MRKIILLIVSVIFTTTTFSQTATSTYTAGDIATTYVTSASVSTSSVATDPGILTVTLPTGNTTITSVDVAYQMTAANTAFMAEQRSFLKCTSTGGTTEATVFSGVGNSEGTYSYSRTNLNIANNVTGGGDIVFELHAFRTYFDDSSNTTHQYVNNNTWSVTVNYNYTPVTPSNPTNFVQTVKGESQINLTWTKNVNNDGVMIAVNSTNTFGTPTNGTSYSVGNSITGGGTIIYTGSSLLFNHSNLTPKTTYYYKIWSVNGANYYSSGVEGNATTVSSPEVSNVGFTITDGIVDIYYDVTDNEESSVTINMEVSDDGGLSYNFACTQVTGDIGENVSIGTNKHIVWNFGREHSGVVGNNFRIKILADDLYGDQIYYSRKIYNTVTIGTQTWLKENLDVGTMINSTTGGFEQTDNSIIEKYCYNNDASNCETYGGLYEWTEAMQYVTTLGTQGICPSGWHIPTLAEWTILSSAVGGNGNSLKAVGQGDNSNGHDGAGTNTSGFSSMLGGDRNYYGGNFDSLSYYTNYWTSTGNSSADYVRLYYDRSDVRFHGGYTKRYGFSIRCLKD